MSDPIAFRLGDGDPDSDEGRALAIFEHWQAQGFRTREIITKALLALEGHDLGKPSRETEMAGELRELLRQAQELTDSLRAMPKLGPVETPPAGPQDELKPEFKSSILKSKRAGFKPKE